MNSEAVIRVVIWAVPVLFSIVIHEVSHGWMANRLGDDTAKRMGRLTLNPLPHIDLIGTVILPFVLIVMGYPAFGWAKPVPYNPYNFNPDVNPKNGAMWVAVAGPASNLCVAFLSSFVFVAAEKFLPGLSAVLYYSISRLAQALIIINLVLACLNLVPVPPLDGSKILMRFLPPRYDRYFMMMERYGFLILVILLATGAFSRLIWAPVKFLYGIFLLIPALLFGVS